MYCLLLSWIQSSFSQHLSLLDLEGEQYEQCFKDGVFRCSSCNLVRVLLNLCFQQSGEKSFFLLILGRIQTLSVIFLATYICQGQANAQRSRNDGNIDLIFCARTLGEIYHLESWTQRGFAVQQKWSQGSYCYISVHNDKVSCWYWTCWCISGNLG